MRRLKGLQDEKKRPKKIYAAERLKAEIRQEALEGKLSTISAPGDGNRSQRAIRRQRRVCLSLPGYQRDDVLLQAQAIR